MNPSPEETLFALALAKPAEKRPAFLDVMCEGDAALRQRLDALLAVPDVRLTSIAGTSGRVCLAEAEVILERLVQLYDAWGKPAQTAEVKMKLAAFQQADKAVEKKGAQQ